MIMKPETGDLVKRSSEAINAWRMRWVGGKIDRDALGIMGEPWTAPSWDHHNVWFHVRWDDGSIDLYLPSELTVVIKRFMLLTEDAR